MGKSQANNVGACLDQLEHRQDDDLHREVSNPVCAYAVKANQIRGQIR